VPNNKDTILVDGGGAVGWDTALQAGRSQVPFPMGSLSSKGKEYKEYILGVKAAALKTAPLSYEKPKDLSRLV